MPAIDAVFQFDAMLNTVASCVKLGDKNSSTPSISDSFICSMNLNCSSGMVQSSTVPAAKCDAEEQVVPQMNQVPQVDELQRARPGH